MVAQTIRLPSDTLTKIFCCAAEQSFNAPQVLRLVCKAWHDIARASQEVWSHILLAPSPRFGTDANFEAFLRQVALHIVMAGQCKLVVRLNFQGLNTRHVAAVLAQLRGRTQQIKSLRIFAPQGRMLEVVPTWLGSDFGQIVPLVNLHLVPSKGLVAFPPTLLFGAMTGITHVVINQLSISLANISIPYGNEASFPTGNQQCGVRVQTPFAHLLLLLSNLASLRTLQFIRPFVFTENAHLLPDVSGTPPILLPQLRDLAFDHVDVEFIIIFLERAYTPALYRLSMRCSSVSRYNLWWFPRNTPLPIKNLVLIDFDMFQHTDYLALLRVLDTLPNIDSLTLADTQSRAACSTRFFDALTTNAHCAPQLSHLLLSRLSCFRGPELERLARARAGRLMSITLEECILFESHLLSKLRQLVATVHIIERL